MTMAAQSSTSTTKALYQTSVRVQAPLERVFDDLAAVERHAEWSGSVEFGLQTIELLDPSPVRLGTRFRSSGRNASGTPNYDVSEVVVFERPHSIGWDTSFRLGVARARFSHRYLLTADGDGTTLTYLLERAEPLNVGGYLLLLYLKYVVGKRGEGVALSGIQAFKKFAEREAPAARTSPQGAETTPGGV